MSASRAGSNGNRIERGLWLAVFLVAALLGWRLQGLAWQHEADAPVTPIEDRRQHHFRNLTYTQTEHLLQSWLRQAYGAPTPREQGLALARVAILQRERGLDTAAQAAAREAMTRSGNDAEVRAILGRTLRADEIRPSR